MKILIVALSLIASVLVGCAQTAPRGKAANLSGDWAFEVQTGQNTVHGAMTLTGQGDIYRGTLKTDQGDNVLTIRSLILDGADMSMVVDSPQGEVRFKGALNADGRSFKGNVTYHNGQTFPMQGNKK